MTIRYVISGKRLYQMLYVQAPPGILNAACRFKDNHQGRFVTSTARLFHWNTMNARELGDPKYTLCVPTGRHCVVRAHQGGIKGEGESDLRDFEGMNAVHSPQGTNDDRDV
ncbi:hypothetical protein J3F83DRAFT_743192 [Trichoderma novae-zelandiae]